MVDVPTPQEPTTQMPTSRVSASDIKGTYDLQAQQLREGDISHGVSTLADGMEQAAVPLAKAAGEQAVQRAVTRNPDGSINVDKPDTSFILGPAGRAYSQTVANGMESALRTKMDQDITDLRQQHAGDPAEFAKAAGSYVDNMRDQYGGQVGNAIWQYGLGVAAQHRDSIVNQKAGLEVQGAQNYQAARLKQLENQLDGLAAQGDTSSDQFNAASAERASLLQKQVDDPLNNYTSEQRGVDDKNFATRLSAAQAAGSARAEYQKTGNLAQAQQMYEKAIEGLPLSVEQKMHYMGEINSHLRSTDALRQQANKDFTDTVQGVKERALATGSVDQQEIENWAREADRRGLPKLAGDLRGLGQYVPLQKVVLGGTGEQSAQALNQLISMQNYKAGTAPSYVAGPTPPGMIQPGNIDLNARPTVHNPDGSISTVRSIGITDDKGRAVLIPTVIGDKVVSDKDAIDHYKKTGEHLGIFDTPAHSDAYAEGLHEAQAKQYVSPARAGALASVQGAILNQESGNNPNAATSVTGARGPGQIQPETFSHYARPGEDINNPDHNRAVSNRIVADYFQRYNGDPARVAVAYFSGPGNVASPGSATPWIKDKSDPTGKTTSSYVSDVQQRVGAVAPPTAPMFHEYVKLAQANYNKHAGVLWDGIDKAFTSGYAPTPQEMNDLRAMAPYITDENLIRKVSDQLSVENNKKLIAGLGDATTMNNAIQTMTVLGQRGGLDNIGRQTLKQLNDDHVREAKMASTDPVTYGQTKTPEVVAQNLPQPTPINWSDPNAASAGIQANRAWLGQGQRLYGNGAGTSPLTAADTNALAGVLQSGDGQAVGGALAAVNSAKPEEIDGILKNDDVRSAVVGAARSSDPGKFSAAMSFLSEQKKRDPLGFDARFGDMKKEVFAYQNLQRYMPQEELVQKMQKFNDPAEVQTRERNAGVADKALQKVDATAVASKFGGWFTHAGAPEGIDDQAGALKTDYNSAYKDMFELTGKADVADKYATEELAKIWGVSPANHSRVMRLPPEQQSYVPAIAGSKEWIQRQFREDVARIAGPTGVAAASEGAFGLEAGGPQTIPTNEREQRASNIVNSALLMPFANKTGSTEADIAAKRMPGYHVSVEEPSTGRRTLLLGEDNRPLIWHPDPREAQAKWGEGFDARQAEYQRFRRMRLNDPGAAGAGLD